MRAADLIGQRIKKEADVAFGVTGGCIINCIDGLHKAGVRCIPMHHEQCAAMAADGYARMTEGLGVCYATSGPGGQNLLTGLASAYYDSIPVLGLIGQVPSKQLQVSDQILSLRQFGFQESNNADMASFVSKGSYSIAERDDVVPTVEYAIEKALEHRRGPCVVELCDDMQRADVEAYPFVPVNEPRYDVSGFVSALQNAAQAAERPVLILGAGVTHDGQRGGAEGFVRRMRMPVLLSWGGKDLLPENNEYNVGGFGVTAERAGNYVLKHADLIVSIGCRLDTHTFGADYGWLGGKRVFVVDNDSAELRKLPEMCLKTRSDIRTIFGADIKIDNQWCEWLNRIKRVRNRFPVVAESLPHAAIRALSHIAADNAIVVGDTGQTLAWLFHAWKVKPGQRLFSDFNNSCMGYALPAAIGAAVACPDRPVYCVIGDGGFMMNLQELQTIRQHNLNIKVVVVDNAGYGMIMQTQASWDTLEYGVSCNGKHNLTFPRYDLVAQSFGLEYCDNLMQDPVSALIRSGPVLVRMPVAEGLHLQPKLLWGDELWNQKPYLSNDEKAWIDHVLVGAA